MRLSTNVFAVLSAIVLFTSACGGTKEEAKAPESDPWGNYKGTYASAGPGSHSIGAPAPGKEANDSSSSDDAAPPAKAKSAAADKAPDDALPPSPLGGSKKSSRGTIKGESLSTITPDALADATKSSFRTKVSSSKMLVGAQYEQVQVQTKSGTSIQIIRPASNPQSGGPEVASPRSRNGSLAKSEAAWYDEDADVLVVVTSGKKGGAQKVLGTLVRK